MAGVGGLEVFAVEQLDRLVCEGKPLDGEVGRDFLGLELDDGGFLLDILLKFLFGARFFAVGKAHDGQRIRALLNEFGQRAGQFDTL